MKNKIKNSNKSLNDTNKNDLKLNNNNKEEAMLLQKEIKRIISKNKPHYGDKKVQNKNGFIIELENVEKSFTNGSVVNHVLKGINLSIKIGEFVVILGKSGSGKTTLMNILSGLTRATEGKTIVADTNLINLDDSQLTLFRRKNIGYIFQEYGLLNTLTVYENVLTGYNLNKKNNNKKIVNEIIDSIGLSLFSKKFPNELSGGQQQRVAIARAIAKNPKIIFGDEPTGAVDSKMSKTILSILKKVNKEKNTTIILITHDSNIAKIADTVYEIVDGKIKSKVENVNPIDPSEL